MTSETARVTEQLRSCYGPVTAIELVRKSQNLVYSGNLKSLEVIFRLTPIGHRTESEIDGELRFLRYLAKSSELTCRVIPSSAGNDYQTIHNGGPMIACCFERAMGRHPSIDDPADVALFADGIATLHSLSRQMTESLHRKTATDSSYFRLSSGLQTDADHEIADWIERLPKTEANFGLIHGDYNTSNALVNGAALKIFDFDDIAYHWYDYDIANSLYMVLFDFRDRTDLSEFLSFRDLFLEKAAGSSAYDISSIHNFIHYRVLLLEGWLDTPDIGPQFVGELTAEWKLELRNFIDWFKASWPEIRTS